MSHIFEFGSDEFPEPMLHGVIEPQWFPDPIEERVSYLTEIEELEEEHAKKIQKQISSFAPNRPMIGPLRRTSGTPRRSRQRRSNASSVEASPASERVMPPTPVVAAEPSPSLPTHAASTSAPQQHFWNRPRRSSTGTQPTNSR